MRWIVDDGPFDTLADLDLRESLGSVPAGTLLLAPSTRQQADQSPARRRLLQTRTSEGPDLFQVFDVSLGDPDDPGGEVYRQLHGEEKTTTHAAEREAIAYALVHAPDAVFVTADKRAAVTALAELGRSRVAHPFDLWLAFREKGALESSTFRRLCERTRLRDQGLERMPGRVASLFG